MPELPLRHRSRLIVAFDAQLLPLGTTAGRVEALAVHRIGLGAQVGEVLVAAADGALVPQSADVDGCDDDLFSRPGVGLGEDAAVEVHDHAAAWPGEGRIVREARRAGASPAL